LPLVASAYKTGARVAQVMPAPAASLAGRAIGAAMAARASDRKRMIARHLQRVHGGALSGPALRRAVQRAFDSYARYWVESFRLPQYSPADLDASMSYEGIGHLEDALAGGKGVILALPHLGAWDFGGAWLATQGYRITVVVEPLEPPELFEWFADYRRSLGMNVVPLGPDAGSAVLRALRANEVVALLSDRDIGGGGVDVEFFGERTTLPGGPATLSLRTGAPILPVALYFEGRGHRGVARPPLGIERTGSLREDVARVTQALAHELESLIRHAPEQWHLMQPNWPSDRE
jgi:phosphatidylinositol dimannoside acyltransferase